MVSSELRSDFACVFVFSFDGSSRGTITLDRGGGETLLFVTSLCVSFAPVSLDDPRSTGTRGRRTTARSLFGAFAERRRGVDGYGSRDVRAVCT